MKRSEPTLDDQIRSIHYKYEIPQDKAEALLASGLRFLEIDKAALLSILAEVPIDTILDMRKDDPWGCIQKKLGLTATLYEERLLRHRARRLHRFYGIPEDRAIPLLQGGYPNHWLRLAYLLEKHTSASPPKISQNGSPRQGIQVCRKSERNTYPVEPYEPIEPTKPI